MLDLETLGNRPGCVIVSIGAVIFGGGEIRGVFYHRVDAEDCVRFGLTLDASTVLWWMRQSAEARSELSQPGLLLTEALSKFSRFVSDPDAEVWGNGASFDNAILSEAYVRTSLHRPWKYFNDRCYRTVKALHPEIPMERTGTHHNALDDAKSQAEHLMRILPNL